MFGSVLLTLWVNIRYPEFLAPLLPAAVAYHLTESELRLLLGLYLLFG